MIDQFHGRFEETLPKKERVDINRAVRDVLELTRGELTKKPRISANEVRGAIAGCPSRSGATAASSPQFDYQRSRGNQQRGREWMMASIL
jgi:hypothetical protein